MIPSECGQLLRACAFYDNRKVTEEAMIAWARAIAPDITVPDAINAIADHHAETSEWCGPSHINLRVRAIRRERLTRAGTPPMPGDLTHKQETEWRQLWCAKVKDGLDSTTAATEASEAMRLPLELEASPEAMQAQRAQLIEQFANRPRAAKPQPAAKPKSRWGLWALGYHDDNDNPIFTADGASALFHDGGPYGIPLERFRTEENLMFWHSHIGGKGWGTPRALRTMREAFFDINPELAHRKAEAYGDLIDQDREEIAEIDAADTGAVL